MTFTLHEKFVSKQRDDRYFVVSRYRFEDLLLSSVMSRVGLIADFRLTHTFRYHIRIFLHIYIFFFIFYFLLIYNRVCVCVRMNVCLIYIYIHMCTLEEQDAEQIRRHEKSAT